MKQQIKDRIGEVMRTVRRAQIEDFMEAVKGMADSSTVREAAAEWYCEKYHCTSVPADSLNRIEVAVGVSQPLVKESKPLNQIDSADWGYSQ